VQPSVSQCRLAKPTLSLVFVPMPSSRMARVLTSEKPAREKSTLRRRVKGSVSTTRSADTVSVLVPFRMPSA
jgi:hypothetical protein